MAMAFPIAAIGLSLLGTMQSSSAASAAGKAQAQALQYNAAINNRNAQIALAQGEADAAIHARDTRKKLAAIQAASAASGFGADPTALDLLESSAFEAEQDKQMIGYKARIKAMGYTDQANLDTVAAANAKTTGANNASTAFLSGLGKTVGLFPSLG